MTDNEKNRCKELLQNKDLFISLCMKENPALGARLDSLYEVFTNQFTIYYRDLLDSGLAAAGVGVVELVVELVVVTADASDGLAGSVAGVLVLELELLQL